MEKKIYYNKDVFVNTILFAIDKTIETLKDSESDGDQALVGMLRRSREPWHNSDIKGINAFVSYEEFIEQLSSKKNIFFLTDEELNRCNKGIEIMDILNR